MKVEFEVTKNVNLEWTKITIIVNVTAKFYDGERYIGSRHYGYSEDIIIDELEDNPDQINDVVERIEKIVNSYKERAFKLLTVLEKLKANGYEF